jgi:hypothetical protein
LVSLLLLSNNLIYGMEALSPPSRVPKAPQTPKLDIPLPTLASFAVPISIVSEMNFTEPSAIPTTTPPV